MYIPTLFLFYQNHKNDILQLCKSHLRGSWSLSCCLWGHFHEIAKPSIIIFYREKLFSWVDPLIDGLMFISIEARVELHSNFPYYEPSVNSSACFGTENKTGTFGGYLHDSNQNVFGITCAHVQSFEGAFTDVQQPSRAAIDYVLYDEELDEELKNSLTQTQNSTSFGEILDGEDYIENNDCCRFDWVFSCFHRIEIA